MLASTVSSKLLKSMAEVEGFQFQVNPNQTNCIVVQPISIAFGM